MEVIDMNKLPHTTLRATALLMAAFLAVGCAGAGQNGTPIPATVQPRTSAPAASAANGPTSGNPTSGGALPSQSASNTPRGSSPSAIAVASSTPPAGIPPTTVADIPQEPALNVSWEATGPNPGQACTADPTIDAQGRLWIIACWKSALWIISAGGKHVEEWTGTTDSPFDFVWGAGDDSMGGTAFAPDGSFYTYEAGSLRVQHFSADRRLLGSWGSFGRGDGQFAKPTAIATDGNGNVYVADASRNDVQVFDSTGALIRKVAEHVNQGGFGYMAVAGDGSLYLDALYEGKRAILRYDATGTLNGAYDLSAAASDLAGLAISSDGHLFVSGYDASTDSPKATLELDPVTGTLVHHWPATGEMFTYDAASNALDVTSYDWTFARQYALPAD